MDNETKIQIAETIYNQLHGRRRLATMAGCKNFTYGEGCVTFHIGRNAKKVTAMGVKLEASDTYTVTLYQGKGVNMRKKETLENVYASQLVSIFEDRTGMFLTL